MKELQQVYGRFESLHFNQGRELTKITHSSLGKYTQSPYLQRVVPRFIKKSSSPRQKTPSKNHQADVIQGVQSNQKSNSKYQLPKISTSVKHKDSQPLNYFRTESNTIQRQLLQGKKSVGGYSSTLEVNTRKQKLQPIPKTHRLRFASKSKAGTNGKQTKINQDIVIIDVKLPFGIKLFCVCDGHGINGHLVSGFIKIHLLKNLNGSMKKLEKTPTCQQLQGIIKEDLLKTNKQLLDSQINTQLSGSTVVAIVIYGKKIISFNVGDSRAIKVKQISCEKMSSQQDQERKQIKYSFDGTKSDLNCRWEAEILTVDHKPDRPDEAERVIANGGRIFCQKNEKGEALGPLRVWMKQIMMPGLAMTRSFGDKAGLKAGTTDQPQILENDLNEDDKFLIVASDGVWEYLENQEVAELITPFYLRGDLDLVCERVIRVASEVWKKVSLSRDDITLIVVSLNEPSNNF